MATRMQQRRGTAAQWTAANPVLAAGEIGFETDTIKFKLGNGSSAWTALKYFVDAEAILGGLSGIDLPATLDTLNELAAAMGDNPAFLTTIATNLTTHQEDTTSIHGIIDTANLALATDLTTHGSDTTSVHGITDTSALVTTTILNAAIATEVTNRDAAVSTHSSDTTSVHGIIDTANLALATDLSTHAADTTNIHGITDTSLLATTTATTSAITAAVSAHESDTTSVHGISDTSALVTTTILNAAIATEVTNRDAAVSTHNSDTTQVHGIADTSALTTTTLLNAAIATEVTNRDAAVATHSSNTTSVHGISNTADLVTTTMLTNALTPANLDYAGLAGVGIDWNSATEALDIDSTVATKTYADGAVSTHDSDTTNVHGITNTALLATTADVAAVTKTTLGLGSVDNTADTAKPVSTAQSTAIATAKAEAIADATAQVTALVTGAPAAMNTLDELAAALGDDANFASSVTTSLGLKVDSLTPISQKTASYTLSSLTERDDLIEMGSGSALTLTIPTDATLDFPIGTSIDILQTGAGQVTVAPVSGTVTVNATPGLKLRTTWSSATLFKRAANTWVVFGDLTA